MKQLQFSFYIYVFFFGKIYHTSDRLTMTNKIFVTFPTFSFNNLCRWSAAVHSMRWNKILAIGWPWQTQYMCRTAALFKRFRYCRLTAPISCTPYSHTAIITLWGKKFANLPTKTIYLIFTVKSNVCSIYLWKKNELTGSHVTPLTSPVWPFRMVTITGTFCISHTITVLSTLQLASHRSRGDHAKSRISPI